MSAERMKRLSQTLAGDRRPDRCQSCCSADGLTRWQEHDADDRPETIIVVLCKRCADEIIEPHPRLYRELPTAEPWPGAMAPCVDCRHRQELDCTSPAAKFNGGPGLKYEPMPTQAHVRRSKPHRSGWTWIGFPVEKCSGFEAGNGGD